jgi:hypothetical protein
MRPAAVQPARLRRLPPKPVIGVARRGRKAAAAARHRQRMPLQVDQLSALSP